MFSSLLTALQELQNADGGWGTHLSGTSQTESTALAIMALEALDEDGLTDTIGQGREWLITRQRSDGAWPRSDDVPEPSWMTSLALLALGSNSESSSALQDGLRWLLGQRGRIHPLLGRLLIRVFRLPLAVELDPSLRGWPWRPETSGWVEPTAYALIALKRFRANIIDLQAEERIREGELLILDRACPGGGWNYGNSRVLGEDLWPYPDITALALMALYDRPEEQAVKEGLIVLEKITMETNSGLSLALASICYGLYGRIPPELRPRLEAEWEATAFGGETRPIAYAAIARQEAFSPFAVNGNG